MTDLNKRSLQLAILRALGSVRHQHKHNLLGRGDAQGDLERQLGIRFERHHRYLAAVAFAELEAAGLIQPTYDDLTSPELWVALTVPGRQVLDQGSVQALERALGSSQQPRQEKEFEQKFKILYSASQAVTDFAHWISADGASATVGILFADIDGFKALNSLYTETVVDGTILSDFQRHLEAMVRHRGCAYRQGGEEFVIALPNHTKDEAVSFAERLRKEVADRTFLVESAEVRITVSIGVAVYPEDGATFAEVVRAANLAEHKAKSEGRDKVVAAMLEANRQPNH